MPEGTATLDDLVRQHERRLFGFFRIRVRDDSVASDLAQETWLEVLGHGETFDPDRGSFWTFTRIWADFVLRRHWQSVGRDRERLDRRAEDEDSPGGALVEARAAASGLASEDASTLRTVLRKVLACALSCERPPNEIVAFGFTKLEWKPREITVNLSASTLRDLSQRLERDYVALVPDPEIAASFAPLRAKLERGLDELLSDPRSKRAYAHVPDGPTGPMKLESYFAPGANPESAVTRWWDTVKRTVFRDLRESGALDDPEGAPVRSPRHEAERVS